MGELQQILADQEYQTKMFYEQEKKPDPQLDSLVIEEAKEVGP